MSWLYSRALVEEYLGEAFSDGELFAPSNMNPMPQAYLSPDRMMDFSRPSRFGMTFAPLTASLGAELLTWFLEGFHARTSAQQAEASASTESAADFGRKWHALSVKFDRLTSSWKIHHSLFPEDLSESSVILPRWGLMRDGELLELMTLALPTKGKDAGLWRTPGAQDGMRGAYGSAETMNKRLAKGGQLSLANQVKHPHLWPTPIATNTKAHHMRGSENGKKREARSYGETGQLNPTWVEWLMGWPLGWTDLRPLEMDKFRNAPQKHGAYAEIRTANR